MDVEECINAMIAENSKTNNNRECEAVKLQYEEMEHTYYIVVGIGRLEDTSCMFDRVRDHT
jgi:hypothetical protein